MMHLIIWRRTCNSRFYLMKRVSVFCYGTKQQSITRHRLCGAVTILVKGNMTRKVILFFAGLVNITNGLRPEIFSKKYFRIFASSKHANFSLKWDFFGRKTHVLLTNKSIFYAINEQTK